MDFSYVFLFFGKSWPLVQQYFLNHVLTWAMAAQLAVGGFAFLLAHRGAEAIRSWIGRLMDECDLCEASQDYERRKYEIFLETTDPFLSVLLLEIAFSAAERFNWPEEGLKVLLILSLAMFLFRSLHTPTTNRFWAGILAAAIWIWAVQGLFHFTDPLVSLLDGMAVTIGRVHISMLTIVRAPLLLLVFYWLSKNLLVIFRLWLHTGSRLPLATRTLLYKLCKVFLFSISAVIVLHYMGIDLTVFTLFGGALGLGVGFGLQKIFVNLVSGFMILADKSIKPGDVIQLGDTYGWINFLGSRYVSVITRSGAEHLIPNESLVTGQVINWSYSNNLVRLQVPVGVSYASDLERAAKLMLEAATATERVLQEPKPACLLKEFGDNAVLLELRVWINDPQNGLGPVKSELLMGVWRRFKEEGIELPYPQRVLHHKSIPEIPIRTHCDA
ncbi:MAG: mechanosensitive ion channel domain-containing protein [Syntrophobacteraceae bacterium]